MAALSYLLKCLINNNSDLTEPTESVTASKTSNPRKRKHRSNKSKTKVNEPTVHSFKGWKRVAGFRVRDINTPSVLGWTTLVIQPWQEQKGCYRVLLYDVTADTNEMEGLDNPYVVFGFHTKALPPGVTKPGCLYASPTDDEEFWTEVHVFHPNGSRVKNLIPFLT